MAGHARLTCACSFRYGQIVKDVLEDEPQVVDGIEVPVDTSQPNPNGMEYDNLYLVSLTCVLIFHVSPSAAREQGVSPNVHGLHELRQDMIDFADLHP